MGIRNRSVDPAGKADIDIDKLNLLDGKRVWWEDFDEAAATTITNLYGFVQTVAATGTCTTTGNSLAHLSAGANGDKAMIAGAAYWTSSRTPTMGVRVRAISETTSVNLQIGWADAAAIAAGIDGPVGDQDWAYLEFDIGDAPTFRLGTRVTGSAATYVDTSQAPSTTTIYNIKVRLTPGGSAIATINGQAFGSAPSTIKVGATDWVPFVRIHADGAAGRSILLDTWYVSESRTDG